MTRVMGFASYQTQPIQLVSPISTIFLKNLKDIEIAYVEEDLAASRKKLASREHGTQSIYQCQEILHSVKAFEHACAIHHTAFDL
jgi:hypothetical protein